MKKKPNSKSPKKLRENLIEKLKNYNNILGELPTIKDSIIELYNISPKEINERNQSNKTLFSFVIEAWDKEKADKINQIGPRILKSNIDSAFKPVEEICKLLIEYMDPSALSITNKTGDLPLHWAIKSGRTELCKLLINKLPSSSLELEWRNQDFYGEQETALQLIYDEYDKLHNRIDLNNITFVDTQHLQIVGNLLISKISPSAREKIISCSVSEKIIKGPYYPQNELIEMIKKYENKQQYKQLTDLIQDNNSDITQVRELLDQMLPEQLMITSQDNDGNTVLIDAIRAYNNPNRNTICELLINKNLEIVNKPNKLGYTALLEAVNQGDLELCKLIMPPNQKYLSYNMLNFSTGSGETPLKAAIDSGKPEIVQYLIEQGYPIQDVLSIINDGPPSTTSKYHVSYNELIYQAIQSNSTLQDLFKYAGEADNIYLSPQQPNQQVTYGESAQVIICNRLKAHIQNHGFPTHRESFLEKLRMVINNEELINEKILGNIPEATTAKEHIVQETNNYSPTNIPYSSLEQQIVQDYQDSKYLSDDGLIRFDYSADP
jgi:ankyrin repeat protein